MRITTTTTVSITLDIPLDDRKAAHTRAAELIAGCTVRFKPPVKYKVTEHGFEIEPNDLIVTLPYLGEPT
jgi:hypothetical protein